MFLEGMSDSIWTEVLTHMLKVQFSCAKLNNYILMSNNALSGEICGCSDKVGVDYIRDWLGAPFASMR